MIKNFGVLTLIQILSYVFPIATLPYLTRTLGAEAYGSLNFAMAIGLALAIFVEAGVNQIAIRNIAQSGSANSSIADQTKYVLSIRITFIVMISIGLIATQGIFEKITGFLVVMAFLAVSIAHLQPVWIYQAIEKNNDFLLILFLTRMLNALLIFALVNSADDIISVLLLQMLTTALGILLMYYRLIKKEVLVFKRIELPQWYFYKKLYSECVNLFKKASSLLKVNLLGNVYGQGNIIFLGVFESTRTLGYYTASQKISWVIFGVTFAVSQAIYPRLSRLWIEDPAEAKGLIVKIVRLYVFFGAILLVLGLFFSSYILRLVGFSNDGAEALLNFWMLVSFFTGLNVLLISFVNACSQEESLIKIYLVVAVVFVVFCYPAIIFYGAYGMQVLMLTIELIIMFRASMVISETCASVENAK